MPLIKRSIAQKKEKKNEKEALPSLSSLLASLLLFALEATVEGKR
jgi:hypothetical protein